MIKTATVKLRNKFYASNSLYFKHRFAILAIQRISVAKVILVLSWLAPHSRSSSSHYSHSLLRFKMWRIERKKEKIIRHMAFIYTRMKHRNQFIQTNQFKWRLWLISLCCSNILFVIVVITIITKTRINMLCVICLRIWI